MSNPEANMKIISRYIEALTKGDYSTLQELLADELEHNLSRSGMDVSISGSADAVNAARQTGPIDVKVHDVFASGDKVVGRYSYTISSDVVPNAQPGKTTEVSGIVIARIANNEIVEVWHEQDALGMHLAFGLVPQPVA
jgi:predicted ester cyclase